MAYKIWIVYYLFIKKIYKKRWKGLSSSAFALAKVCLLIIILFIVELSELLFNYKGLSLLYKKEIPLSALVFIFSLVLFMIWHLVNAVFKPKLGITEKKRILVKVNQIKSIYPISFIISVIFLLIGVIIMTIMLAIRDTS